MDRRAWPIALLVAGILCASATSVGYFFQGYHLRFLYGWLLSMVLAGGFFVLRRYAAAPLRLSGWQWECGCVIGLLISFAPVYLASLYTIPFQINSDEIVVLAKSKYAAGLAAPNLFGLTPYYRLPLLIFVLYGRLASAFGSPTFVQIRQLDACAGLIAILMGYGFFRLSLPRRWALGAAVLMGANHALIGLSRMGLRANTALVVEIAAIGLLLRSLQRRNAVLAFVGGLIGGLSFYTYFPARGTLIVWLAWILLVLRRSLREQAGPAVFKLAGASLLGWAMAMAPMAATTLKEYPQSVQYMRQQLLLYPEGRQLQQTWWYASPTIPEAIRRNIRNGLLAFNGTSGSGTSNYHNPGHGFVDPLTGVVLWIGLAALLFLRRGRTQEELLAVTGFLSLWLGFTFLVTKNPDYSRMLILLPFTAHLAITGMVTAAGWLARRLPGNAIRWSAPLTHALVAVAVAVSVAWNFRIYRTYVNAGVAQGDVLGGVVRYLDARRNSPGYSYYLVGNPPADPYPENFSRNLWEYYLWNSVGPHQQVQCLTPDAVIAQPLQTCPFSLLMRATSWTALESGLRSRYPDLGVHRLMPDGSLVALETTSCTYRAVAPLGN